MASTREKINAVIDHVRSMPPDEASSDTRDLVEMLQISQGFGFDPLAAIVPQSEAEADILVDKLIALLLSVRGDDLPPFDLELVLRESE